MVGMYALSKKNNLKVLGRAIEKAIVVGSAAVWSVQIWNVLNVVAEMALAGK